MNDSNEKDKNGYKFKVDNKTYESNKQKITGNEILLISNNTPTEKYRLDMKIKGGETKKILLEEEVDLSLTGLEKFMTIPLGPTEG